MRGRRYFVLQVTKQGGCIVIQTLPYIRVNRERAGSFAPVPSLVRRFTVVIEGEHTQYRGPERVSFLQKA